MSERKASVINRLRCESKIKTLEEALHRARADSNELTQRVLESDLAAIDKAPGR